jgi:hypothetical protein
MASTSINATNRNTNFTLLPIIKSLAACIAFIGYSPGAVTATKAIKVLDNRYPDINTINVANIKNTSA